MKIEGPSNTRNTTGTTRKKGAAGGSGVQFESFFGGEEEATKQVDGSGPLVSINPFLSLQEVDEQPEKQERAAKERGEAMLAQLDRLHLGLLNGAMPEKDIRQLSQLIASERQKVTDPRLKEVLDEIEVRAAVELAKLEKAAEKAQEK